MVQVTMAKNMTENDRLGTDFPSNASLLTFPDRLTTDFQSNASLLNGTSPTDEQLLTRERRYVMEDPIVLAILGVVAVIVIVIVSRAVINKIVSRRRHIYRSESAMSYCISDPPPPYPGKHRKTSIDYLPSYDSAMALERMRRETQEQYTLTEPVSVHFSISSETSETRGAAKNTNVRNSTEDIGPVLKRTRELASGSRFNQLTDHARIDTISGRKNNLDRVMLNQ